MDTITRALGKPKIIYTDHDASTLSNELKIWFTDKGLKNVVTRHHVRIAERAIRCANNG